METLKAASDTLFILLDSVVVLAMHAGFAFLELGTVRRKNQVNALAKIPGVAGTSLGVGIAVAGAALVYATLKATMGLRLSPEEDFNGADLTLHTISATAERDTAW